MQNNIAVWFVDNWLIVGIIGAVLCGGAYIISWIVKASQTNKSEISLGNDFISGTGFIGSADSNLYMDDNVSFMQFALPYEKVTSVSTDRDYLIIFAGSTKYTVKTQNAAQLASQIQNIILQRHRSRHYQ